MMRHAASSWQVGGTLFFSKKKQAQTTHPEKQGLINFERERERETRNKRERERMKRVSPLSFFFAAQKK
jgi:hypothetical protein